MKRSKHPSPDKFIYLLGLIFTLAWTSPAYTSHDKRADAEALTHSLVGLNNAYQKAAPNAKSAALQKLIDTTVERQAQLAELIKTDPDAVLRVALPERVRKQMPAQVQSSLEQHVDLEGELEVVYEDYEDGSYRLRHTLNAQGNQVALHFKSPPMGLLSNTQAAVSGVLVDDAMAVESGEDDVLMLALDGGADGGTNNGSVVSLSNTFGQQRTAVILVNFPTNPSEPWTVMEAEDVVFGAVNDYILENSYGQTSLAGDVFGWFTIPVDPSGCPTSMIALEAGQFVEATGADLSTYDRLIYAFPDIGCSWGAEASVGGEQTRAFFDGTLMSDNAVGHEIGHNFGLYHSHRMHCGDVVVADSGCNVAEYGDVLDRMGGSAGHFNSFQKERLGWLEYSASPPVVTAETSGSYQLEPVSKQANGVKALRVLQSVDPVSGQRTWYYLETRQAVGFDSWLIDSSYADSVLDGLVIRLGTESDPDSSFLLDMTPGSQKYDMYDLALPLGAGYTDASAGVTISLDEINAEGATVNVSFGQQTCVRADPSVSLSPSSGEWVAPGTPVNYTVNVSNNDGNACSDVTFELTAQLLADWTATFTDPSISLAPGTSFSSSLTVTSSLTAIDGVYDIGVTATQVTHPANSGMDNAIYTVMEETVSENNPPVAVDDSVLIQQVEPVVIDVLGNDWDPDNDSIQVAGVSQGAKGSVVNNGDGTLTYIPGKRFKNKDSFSYDISDGIDSATATVSISLQESPKGGGRGGGKKNG